MGKSVVADKEALAFSVRLRACVAHKGMRPRGAYADLIGMLKSQHMSVRPATMSGYKNGSFRPEFEKIQVWAPFFGVDPAWLYSGKGKSPSWYVDRKGAPQKLEPASTAPERADPSGDAVGALGWITAVVVGHVLSISRPSDAERLLARLEGISERHRNTKPGADLVGALEEAYASLAERQKKRRAR